MKKGLVVLLVLLTAACLFASDFSVGAKLGLATGGTAKLKANTDVTTIKEKVTYSGFALGLSGSYAIDSHYSAELDCDFVFPSKISDLYYEGGKGTGLEGMSKKEFKKEYGDPKFFAFKLHAGVGYALPVDSMFDFKVGGGLAFNRANLKGGSYENKTSGIGVYGFAQALYPVANKISLTGTFDAEISLYGKTKNASGLMFFPSCTFSVGAVYHI